MIELTFRCSENSKKKLVQSSRTFIPKKEILGRFIENGSIENF